MSDELARDYAELLHTLKGRIEAARIKAALAGQECRPVAGYDSRQIGVGIGADGCLGEFALQCEGLTCAIEEIT